MLENYVSPEGRLVQGSAFARQDKDKAGKPHKKEDGTPYTKGFIGVAFKKGDPAVEQMIAAIRGQGPIEVPHCFINGQLNPPTRKFSYKIIDGDGVDDDGLPNSTKEGFAGHWVIRMSTMFDIKAFPTGKYGIADQLIQQPGAPEPFGRGNYVRVIFTVKSNASNDKPGLAIYPSHVEFLRAGTPIISGPSAATLFGQAGAAAAPSGPTYIMQPSANGATRESLLAAGWTDAALIQAGHMVVQAPVAAPAPPAPAPAAPLPPAAPAAPLPPGGSAPTPPAPAPIAAAAPGFRMADPNGTTYAAYIAAGWTDAALAQNQIMVPA